MEFWAQTPRSYGVVLGGRAKGNQERILALAHQTEAMARQKTLRPLAHYLNPPKRSQGSAKSMIAMLRRIKAKGERGTPRAD